MDERGLSEKAKKRIQSRVNQGVYNAFTKRNKLQTVIAQKRAKKTRELFKRNIKKVDHYTLLVIGAVLYWAEGYKRLKIINGKERTNHPISFTNSDPNMVAVFVRFLLKVMKVPKDEIRISMRLFKHNNEKEAIRYWSKVSGLAKKHFERPSYIISKSSLGIRPFNRLPFGTIQVRVSNTPRFYQLMGWIDGLKEKLLFK